MSYIPLVDRMNFTVKYPQLEIDLTQQRSGKKRFDLHKNVESSYQLYTPVDSKSYNNAPDQIIPDIKKQALQNPALSYSQNPGIHTTDLPVSYSIFSNKYSSNPEGQKHLESSQTTKTLPNPLKNHISNPSLQEKSNKNPYPWYQDPPKNRNLSQDPSISYDPYLEITQKPNKSSENPQFVDEIDKLQAELKMKEKEILKYHEILINKANSPPPGTTHDVLSKISKQEYDRQKFLQQRMQTSNDLEFQMYEKYKEKQQALSQKDKEQMQRLEMLRMMQEKEAKERLEKLIRAKEYKEQLDFQAQVKKVLNPEKHQKKFDLQKFEGFSNTLTPSPGQGSSVILPKFTKKNPKTLCYNPITGDSKDTSQYVYGRFPRNSGENESTGFNENAYKNIEEDAKAEGKSEEKFLSGYGSLVLQNTKN
ncbi:hypothetical protein SteCoe_28135 [Stentor coeruleus]|uniref:Uncharacterized protein n=1 Tax=Stentor coeruleus TaxID=5963 RepID=A0A1R2B8V9_9CILI|nr:hypothetical protein SteCoe_28135 [Stentor coeruleus]